MSLIASEEIEISIKKKGDKSFDTEFHSQPITERDKARRRSPPVMRSGGTGRDAEARSRKSLAALAALPLRPKIPEPRTRGKDMARDVAQCTA